MQQRTSDLIRYSVRSFFQLSIVFALREIDSNLSSLAALPNFVYAMPVQLVILGITMCLLGMLLIHLLFTIRYHLPLSKMNYALQVSLLYIHMEHELTSCPSTDWSNDALARKHCNSITTRNGRSLQQRSTMAFHVRLQ